VKDGAWRAVGGRPRGPTSVDVAVDDTPSVSYMLGSVTSTQGRTLVHFSAQLERFLLDLGCAQGLCSPC